MAHSQHAAWRRTAPPNLHTCLQAVAAHRVNITMICCRSRSDAVCGSCPTTSDMHPSNSRHKKVNTPRPLHVTAASVAVPLHVAAAAESGGGANKRPQSGTLLQHNAARVSCGSPRARSSCYMGAAHGTMQESVAHQPHIRTQRPPGTAMPGLASCRPLRHVPGEGQRACRTSSNA